MTLSGMSYLCSAGESFDSVALEVYGDEEYACDLLCANPALCGKIIFDGGEMLRLPVVEIPEDEDAAEDYARATAPWKE